MVLIVMAVFFWLRRLDASVEQISDRVARATVAAHSMEVEVNGLGAGILDQLHSPRTPRRERVPQDIEEFRAALAEFRRVAEGTREHELADQVEERFDEYLVLGQLLLSADERGGVYQQNLEAFMNLRVELDEMLAALQMLLLEQSLAARQRIEQGIRQMATTALVLLVFGVIIVTLTGGTIGRAVLASEQRLSESRDTLELRVNERTAELAETNFALARSNEDLEQFASVASHDLQEPLRKIQAFGARLHDKYQDKLDEQGIGYIERMQAAAARMRRLIDALLVYSRVTTKAQPFERVDLTRVVEDVVVDLEDRIQESGGSVVVEPLPTIEADPVQMRQLFQNLIANGLKFQRPGIAPLVRLEADQNDRMFCRVRVIDNGIGFDEAYLDRIFDVFQRLHGRSEYEGTGIGLAICRKIVERHGGSVAAQSRSGAGATFVVTLPVKHGEIRDVDRLGVWPEQLVEEAADAEASM